MRRIGKIILTVIPILLSLALLNVGFVRADNASMQPQGMQNQTPVTSHESLMTIATQKLAADIVNSMPDDVHMRLLAVTDIKGDDGELRDAIISQIKQKKPVYILVERKHLDEILKEQALQEKDLIDSQTRVQMGEISGVEGILFGKVTSKYQGLMSAKISVFLQLDNVRNGTIVFSKEFTVKVVSPYEKDIILALIIFFIITIVLIGARKFVVGRMETIGEKDEDIRMILVRDTNKAATNLSMAHEYLMKKKDKDNAALVYDVGKDLSLLKQEVERVAKGDTQTNTWKEFKKMYKEDKKLDANFQDIINNTDKIYKDVMSERWSGLKDIVIDLKSTIKDTIVKIQGRTIK
jgi:curli biogenesis system outer membrane secretion channel CsgG